MKEREAERVPRFIRDLNPNGMDRTPIFVREPLRSDRELRDIMDIHGGVHSGGHSLLGFTRERSSRLSDGLAHPKTTTRRVGELMAPMPRQDRDATLGLDKTNGEGLSFFLPALTLQPHWIEGLRGYDFVCASGAGGHIRSPLR